VSELGERGGVAPPLGVEGASPPPERSELGFTGFPRSRVSDERAEMRAAGRPAAKARLWQNEEVQTCAEEV